MKYKKGYVADIVALPFWIILISYAIYQIKFGNPSAWIVLIIISGALMVDSSLIIEYLRNRK